MTRMTDESGQRSDRVQYARQSRGRKKKSLRRKIAERIGMGILCSCIATVIVNFAGITKFLRYACAAVVHVGGDPISGQGGIMDKIDHKIDEVKKSHAAIPPVVSGVPKVSPLHKSPEQLKAEAELKEAERKRREESERKTLLARADVVGLECEDDWPLEKLRIEVQRAEHEAEETARKKPLLARADKIGLQVDPTADSKTLKHQVEEGEKEAAADADYQAKLRQYERDLEAWKRRVQSGPNARCPKCGHTMRFNASRINTQFLCSSCNGVFPVRMAMARWKTPPPPKEPLPPKKNPGLWKRIFG